jgi:hypothetical protein
MIFRIYCGMDETAGGDGFTRGFRRQRYMAGTNDYRTEKEKRMACKSDRKETREEKKRLKWTDND